MSCSWNDVPACMVVNTWHHIGNFTKEWLPHPDLVVEEDENLDPLASHEGHPQCRHEDEKVA